MTHEAVLSQPIELGICDTTVEGSIEKGWHVLLSPRNPVAHTEVNRALRGGRLSFSVDRTSFAAYLIREGIGDIELDPGWLAARDPRPLLDALELDVVFVDGALIYQRRGQ